MPIIKLQILASDIKETNYADNEDCPIARALKRAGAIIVDVIPSHASFTFDNIRHSAEIRLLNDKVIRMYHFVYDNIQGGNLWETGQKEEPVDFEWELEY